MLENKTKQELLAIVDELLIDKVFNCYTRQALDYIDIPEYAAVVALDIDKMHDLNDMYGYEGVNEKLKRALSMRKSDEKVARWFSGDELLIIAHGSTDQYAMIERLQNNLTQEGITATFAEYKGQVPDIKVLAVALFAKVQALKQLKKSVNR